MNDSGSWVGLQRDRFGWISHPNRAIIIASLTQSMVDCLDYLLLFTRSMPLKAIKAVCFCRSCSWADESLTRPLALKVSPSPYRSMGLSSCSWKASVASDGCSVQPRTCYECLNETPSNGQVWRFLDSLVARFEDNLTWCMLHPELLAQPGGNVHHLGFV